MIYLYRKVIACHYPNILPPNTLVTYWLITLCPHRNGLLYPKLDIRIHLIIIEIISEQVLSLVRLNTMKMKDCHTKFN